jgi:diadenosine tetraphosphate (Ap4A) HIT family hydrolase
MSLENSTPESIGLNVRISESAIECLFCRQMRDPSLLQSRLVYEDEFFHASHYFDERAPTLLGLVLIQTKRHVNDLSELTDSEAQGLGILVQKISKALKSSVGAAWTYCYCFMEGVRHVHVFVSARYPSLPKEYVRLNISNWPEAPTGRLKEVGELAIRLRSIVNQDS